MPTRGLLSLLTDPSLQLSNLSRNSFLFSHAAHDVENLGRDFLLAALVVLQRQFAQQLLAVVAGNLHGHGAGGVLGSGSGTFGVRPVVSLKSGLKTTGKNLAGGSR